MGGGGSSSQQTKETNITTTTETNIRDIGFTGANAVDIAAILESGTLKRTEITAGVLNNLIQATGAGYNQVIGGASQLVDTAKNIAETTAEKQRDIDDVSKMNIENMKQFTKFVAVGTVALFLLSNIKRKGALI